MRQSGFVGGRRPGSDVLERLLTAAVTLLAVAWCLQQALRWLQPLLIPGLLLGGLLLTGTVVWRRRYW